MSFLSMCLIGYKIIAFSVLVIICGISIFGPVATAIGIESGVPLLFYIFSVPIACGCIKLMNLL